MEKTDRKTIHTLANSFGLKSKSAGQGKLRHPVLYRTRTTLDFDEQIFAAAIGGRISYHNRFMPRMDVGDKNSSRNSGRGRGGGGGFGAASYRDGDIVGASAPELGANNKGRSMLEKMGWSTGTALGALNNKGMLQPVSHVVKNSKAGLG